MENLEVEVPEEEIPEEEIPEEPHVFLHRCRKRKLDYAGKQSGQGGEGRPHGVYMWNSVARVS